MTELLVLSDSHGHTALLNRLFQSLSGFNGKVIHLGDGAADMLFFQDKYPEWIQLKGNMDGLSHDISRVSTEKRLFSIEALSIMAVHGHTYQVHHGLVRLKKAALDSQVGLVLFGHTHCKENFIENGIQYFNPGAFKDSSYGIIRIEGNTIIEASHLTLK